MKERFNHQLPAEVGGKKQYLPNFVTISVEVDGQTTDVQVHPDRVDNFIQGQQEMNGGKIKWERKH